jgi:glutamyl-tRNA reductase
MIETWAITDARPDEAAGDSARMILALVADRTAPTELRSRLAYDEPTQRSLLGSDWPGVGELAILCTCHRTEVYFTTVRTVSEAVHGVAGILPGLLPTDVADLQVMEGLEAVEHLFRVTCGLDSRAVGEPQVLGQVRRAYVLARDMGASGPTLANIFGRAIRLGRRVRTGTGLGRIGQSSGAIAAEHLRQRLGGLAGRAGVVVGAGEAATDAAERLAKSGARLSVVSRTKPSAAKLADGLDAPAYGLRDLAAALDKSEFAVVAVSGGIFVRPRHLPTRGADEPFVMVDLSVPRAVDTGGRADVDLRSLEEIRIPEGPDVAAAITAADLMVADEVARLGQWWESRKFGPAIRQLRERAESVVTDEVARAVSGLDLPEPARARIEALGMRLANKLLHGPTAALREADEASRMAIMRMFGLDGAVTSGRPGDSHSRSWRGSSR